jgi:hypothetical protein
VVLVYMLPFERKDLAKTRSGEYEQTDGRNCPRSCVAILGLSSCVRPNVLFMEIESSGSRSGALQPN